MMHGKSVSHVDVSIRFHHVIHRCSWRATVCSFSGADKCGGLLASVGVSVLITKHFRNRRKGRVFFLGAGVCISSNKLV